eukprot:GHVL01014511.1.p1 GENE.GHVL01014511.1~~GHVL01014511.1.p1  ORF type:complete len:262 (+),score=34.48 GHVL01014511.1:42-827(+)
MGNALNACNPQLKRRLLLIGCNYENTPYVLSRSIHDCRKFKTMCKEDGLIEEEDIVELYDDHSGDGYPDFITVSHWLQEIATECGPRDTLAIFYSGHGSSVFDESEEAQHSREEAFCFRGSGSGTNVELMVDGDFADLLTTHLKAKVGALPRVLIFTECCHTGTIMDLERNFSEGKTPFENLQVISIGACSSSEDSGEPIGTFVSSLQRAVNALKKEVPDQTPTISEIFERVRSLNRNNKKHKLSMTWTPEADPVDFAWPF